MPDRGKRILGIDENGLGPFMGPLTVTGTIVRFGNEETSWFGDISDSKIFFNSRSSRNFALVEEAAISIFFLLKRMMPSGPREILKEFCRFSACSSGRNICTGDIPEDFPWANPAKAAARSEKFLQWADLNRVVIEDLRSVFICPREFNRFTLSETKLLLDFLSFCRIIEETEEKDGLWVEAGKIGGLKFYLPYMKAGMKGYSAEILCERDAESVYLLEKDGEKTRLGFLMDVEKRSFPAALSSIAGKYIREISMLSIRKCLGISEDISGYHDRKTRRIMEKTGQGDLPEDCLFRFK